MKTARFLIKKMDCPTEEQLIRNRLQGVDGITALAFNLMARELTVEHRHKLRRGFDVSRRLGADRREAFKCLPAPGYPLPGDI